MQEGDAGYRILEAIGQLYTEVSDSISKTGGVTNLMQKAKLGKLNKLLAVTNFLPRIENSAVNIVKNPGVAAEKFNQLGITDKEGNPLTAEMLTEGVTIDENGGIDVLSLRKAISNNRALAALAIADATGRIMVAPDTYVNNAMTGQYLGGQVQYETFVETASPEAKAAIAKLIGTDDLDTIEYKTFAKRMDAYGSTEEGRSQIDSAVKLRDMAEKAEKNDKKAPMAVSEDLADGVHRFGGDDGIAIIKNGDKVRIYDYGTKNISYEMSVKDATTAIQQHFRENKKTEVKTIDEKLDAYAKENVQGYESLPANARRSIRALIRQARALGVPEADILMYARVSARSGIRVSFSKERCRYRKKDKSVWYLDGFYSPKSTEIVINPEGKRSSAKLLMHELSHALFGYRKYRAILGREMTRMDKAYAKALAEPYLDAGKSKVEVAEELAVHHVEDVLGTDSTLERVVSDEPGIKSKILSFFKLAKSDYSGNERLSRSAGRLYERFDAAFKAFGERNRANLGYEAMPFSSTETIKRTQDGAVESNPVTEMVVNAFDEGDRFSITTETTPLPKQEMSVTGGEGTILDSIEGVKPTPVKGLSDRTVNGYTGREIREYAMLVNGFSKAQVKRVDKFMGRMGDFIKKAGVTYRFIGLQDVENAQLHYSYNPDGSIKSIVLSAMVKNGDYPVNFDLSSICKKRVAMSTLIDKLANRGSLDNGTVALDPQQIFSINTALKNAGYETACLGCFVESKRYNAMAWATEFCKKWNAAVKAVNKNATYFGYGDGSNVTDVTLEQAIKLDDAANKFVSETKTKRLEQALKKYKDREAKGLQLVESKNTIKVDGEEITTLTKAARERIAKSETISDDLKTRYLTTDVSEFNMADVEFLLVNGALPGVALSNKQTVKALVESGEAYQHLLRPSDLLTAKGIDKLRELPNFHGALYGHYGSATPKLVQSFTPYNSEIALLPSKKGGQSLVEYLYSIAGVRMQSFSDFQIQNIYDYLQMVADLAARKLPAHAYTKEISFAKLLGMTGIKTNLSVMFDIDPTVDKAHAGLIKKIPFIHKGEYGKVVFRDETGEYVYNVGDFATQRAFMEANPTDERRFLQSIGFADAVKLQTTEGYSSNCGIIGVGYSDIHILAMLDDPRIRYVIPYHASGLPAIVKLATNIALATDYTSTQNTMKIDSIVDKNGNAVEWSIKEAYKRLGSGKAVMEELNAKIKNDGWEIKTKKAQNGHGSFGLYEDLQATNDPRATVSNFMDWCAKNNTLPLFYQFSTHENYYKLIYDFNVYDCITEQYAPQQAVTNTYPDADMHPVDAAEADLDTSYLEGAIDKQMAFMNAYSESLDSDLDAMADDLSGIKPAIPSDLPDESESVGKYRKTYKPSRKEKFFTTKDRAYIEMVDELYGIAKYLGKVGNMSSEKVGAILQMARASRGQAQTMIDSDQYDVFSDNPKRLGKGLLKIYEPTLKWSAQKKKDFELYLLHYLNIDRMTLESRSKMWTSAERANIAKVESDIDALEKAEKQLHSDIRKAETAIVNARVKAKLAKNATAKNNFKMAVQSAYAHKRSLEATLKQTEADKESKKSELSKLKKDIKATEIANKPVFGKGDPDESGKTKRDHDVTAAESAQIVSEYEKNHPEFVTLAKEIYAFLDNNMAARVKAGLITQESADRMKQLYPHYVPAYRDKNGVKVAVVKGKNNMAVSTTVKKAKGGSSDILDIATSIAEQTDELMRAGRINMLARALYDVAKETGDTTYVEILAEEDAKDHYRVSTKTDNTDSVNAEGKEIINRPKGGQITFYKDGKKVTMRVSKEIELAFDGMRSPTVDFTNPLVNASSKITSLFKRLATSLAPAFMIRNPIRDVQDAGFNSKHPVRFAKMLASGSVIKDIATNSAEWKLYRAMGGFSSTVFEGALARKGGYAGFESVAALFGTDAKGIAKAFDVTKALTKSPLVAVENGNIFLEQMTRFAEFKASLKAGDSPAVALNNSAEVTTNFGRRGRTSKVLNATIMPFLNPAIQGFDKIFRNVGDAFTSKHYVKGVTELLVKAALIGVAPILLNSIMYEDDEDYEKLRETDKENYFLVKIGDGNFIKIPRGRLASVIGGAYSRATKAIKGEEVDAGDYVSNVITQVTPVENLTRTIFSPIFDVRNNRTWYGGEIEGQEFDDTSPKQRYDESTSTIAVAIGQVIPEGWNMSPKKIHYLLDQYSGVIGDFVLPATSQKEHKGFFSGNFTIDSVTNNKLSTQFYDLYEKTQYADTAGDEAASYRLKYLNRVKKSIREMNKEIDEVRSSDIDNKEKMAQVRVIRALINAAYDSALKSVEAVDEAITATAAIEDEDIRDAEITRRVLGAESALKNYNKKSYEKYQLFNKAGIGYDELYAYHFATLGLETDTDKKGNVIEGSKRKKVVQIVNSLNVSSTQKILLLAAKGYAIKDGDIRGVSADKAKKTMLSYIMRQKLSKEEKAELAKACGFTVKNGVIVNK